MNSFAPTFRLWLAAAVAGCYSTACPDPRPEHAPPQAHPSEDHPVAAGGAASAPAPGSGGASALPTGVDTPGVQVIPTPGPGRVIVELAGKPMALTVEDGRALQALLLARLRESDVPDKDFLIGFTQNAQPRLDTGELRIGVWLLQVFDQQLMLRYRMPAQGVSGSVYSAAVTRGAGGWEVGQVLAGIIHYRRP